jgi:hypothetical protein
MMMMEDPPPPADLSPADILLIVEQSILTSLSDEISQYREDIISRGGTIEIRPFSGNDSVEELKVLLKSNRETISGAFLVGDLPTAWYEQKAFNKNEEFPFDIFLMDLDATWTDADQNGLYDGHSPLNLSIYVSRITGDLDEIQNYFSKLHDYRIGNYEFLGGAYIFKDDDWFNTNRSSTFGLDRLYDTVLIHENQDVTEKDDYIYRLEYDGADYVYQWIHATSSSLYIRNSGYYSSVRQTDIKSMNLKGRFLNMFNCKGARYTDRNLGMSYLNGTDTGLAVTGSTKVGGNYYPLEFHRALALGSSWGNAFKSWYNYYGKKNDAWFLGMVILGDPALSPNDIHIDKSLGRASFTNIIPPTAKKIQLLGENLSDFEKNIAFNQE